MLLFFHYYANAQNEPELFPGNDRKEGALGYFLKDGTKVIKGQFCSASYNIDGYYIVSLAEHEVDSYGNKKERHIPNTEKFGLLNGKGQFIINFKENYNSIYVKNGIIQVGKNNLYGIVNDKNEIVVPVQFEELEIKNQSAIIAKLNSKAGIINKENKIVIPFIYDEIDNFVENRASFNFLISVKKDNKIAIINQSNKIVVPFSNNKFQFITENSICIIKDNKFRLVDYNLKSLIPMKFNIMYTINEKPENKIYAENKNYGYYFTNNGTLLKKEKLINPVKLIIQ